MNVAGIDYSTRAIDIVLVPLDEGAPIWHRYVLEGQDSFERTRSVANAMPWRAASFWDDVLAVGIEHPAGHHGTGPLLRVQGAVLACLPTRVLVEPWPPGKWRKAVGLAGNATKGAVEFWSGSLMPSDIAGLDNWPQDAHDAHLIALATRQAIQTQQAA